MSSDVTSLLTLVLCDRASTHSWVSLSLVHRLGPVGEPVNLSISGFISTTVVETERINFTVSSEPNNSYFVFSLCAYVKDTIQIGSELINIADLQNKYPQLAPIKLTQYTYEDVEVIIGQDYYHAVRPIEFILGDDKNSLCSVRLPIGWVISGPLPPSVVSTSSCFKCVVEDSSLTDQIKSQYELKSYGAFKQVDFRSVRINMLYPSLILKPFTMAKDTLCLCFGLIVKSVYQTTITRHSPNLKHWRED